MSFKVRRQGLTMKTEYNFIIYVLVCFVCFGLVLFLCNRFIQPKTRARVRRVRTKSSFSCKFVKSWMMCVCLAKLSRCHCTMPLEAFVVWLPLKYSLLKISSRERKNDNKFDYFALENLLIILLTPTNQRTKTICRCL